MSTRFLAVLPNRSAACLALGALASSLSGCASGGPASDVEGGATGAVLATDFAYDAEAPLDVRIVAESRLGPDPSVGADSSPSGVTRLDLSYASPHGGRVPAWLFVPEGPGPHPAVILQHGMPGSRNTHAHLATEYARAGAIVLAPTAPFGRPDPVHRARSFVTGPLFDERDRDELVHTVVDLRRAVDLLRRRDDVDAERIAYVGISYGGWAGAVLAGVEHRIVAYALVVAPTSLSARFQTRPSGLVGLVWDKVTPAGREAWRIAMSELDGRRFVGFAAPARLLFQIGREDRQVPADDAESLAAAASEPKTVLRYDADHPLTPAAYRQQAEWLAEILGLDVSDFDPPDYRRRPAAPRSPRFSR